MERWGLSRAPVRIAGDALNLPFADGSLRFVMTYQTLSQFMDIESVFLEVKRVLAPGGVFLFAEEPLLRLLSLRLYRVPYYNAMKPWERKLFDWGLLGYLVKDVIGAYQEESFGIRQNHSMYLNDWHKLVARHFAGYEYQVFVPERGWGERVAKRLAIRLDPTVRNGARLVCWAERSPRSAAKGKRRPQAPSAGVFEKLLRCPDCHVTLERDSTDTLVCAACGYQAPTKAASTTCFAPATVPNSTRATARTSSIAACPATSGACWMAGTKWKEFSEINTAGSARAPRCA